MSSLPDPAPGAARRADQAEVFSEAAKIAPQLRGIAMLGRYASDLDQIALAALRDPTAMQNGRQGLVQYQQTFSLGKQQPVCGYRITVPEDSAFEVVIRSCPTRHAELLDRPALARMRSHFPAILRTVHDATDSWRSALVLEHIDGSDDKSGPSDYLNRFAAPGGLDKLTQEIFPGICEVYAAGLSIADLAPHQAHNVIYDRNSDRFRLLDLGCVLHWHQPIGFFVETLLGPQLKDPGPRGLEYLAKMLALFDRAFPDELATPTESRQTAHYFPHSTELASQLPGSRIVAPEMPEHHIGWSKLCLDPTQPTPRLGQPLLVVDEEVKFYVDARLIEAARAGNVNRFAQILELSNHRLGRQRRA
ncbi:MAG: hypothetical protein K1X83_12560 [Oligoflexia bacterium]|nr:hypothetical protein [Oligoflexia bacterium]